MSLSPAGSCRSARRGSIVVVIMIAVVLVALGGLAMTMSTSFGRTGYHEKLVADSRSTARAAVEEAALLINNGKRNVEIDTAAGTAKPVEVPLAELEGGRSPLASLPADQRPKVFVKASIINNTTGLYREGARQQMESIQKFTLPVADQKAREFWERVEKEGLKDKDTGEDRSADSPNAFVANWVDRVGVSGWKPAWERYPEPEGVDANGVKQWRWRGTPRMPALKAVWELFHTASGSVPEEGEMVLPEGQEPPIVIGDKPGKPSIDDFKTKWTEAIRCVSQDAAKKVEACGANPSLAMAHLVGDLKIGKEIASGAEVEATAAFMRDNVIGTNKTYLLELTSAIGYEGAQGRMKGKTAFRTYRLFQKAEWEMAMKRMAAQLACDLQKQGPASLSSQDLATLFPPDPKVEERNEPVPGKDGKPTAARYDPKKMFDDIVYAQMPSTVGARLYPYGIASVDWDPDRVEAKDAK